MNKQAYLENVYNSSFNDELEKIAMTTPFITAAAKKSAKVINITHGKEAYRKALGGINSVSKKFEMGKIPKKEFMANIKEKLGRSNEARRALKARGYIDKI